MISFKLNTLLYILISSNITSEGAELIGEFVFALFASVNATVASDGQGIEVDEAINDPFLYKLVTPADTVQVKLTHLFNKLDIVSINI